MLLSQYLGDWYVQRNFYGTVCERAQYTDLGNGNISVWNTFTAGEAGSQVEGGCAWAELTDPECDCGDQTVTFPGTPGGPYLILDTDYETFTSVYACVALGMETPWVLTREKNPPEETVSKYGYLLIECSTQNDTFQIERALDAFRRNGVREPEIKGEHLPECKYDEDSPNCADDFPPPK